ncbi:NAD(P)-binding Rossmann-fold superfamily protein [Rhynchospora pubera]|uniref:NAD(P)-binding Rossmann-fold superfamily protein n=1 Tax=Rhynchospora pubera TaxID=906938 RepID=A0AAV8C637_9POAL|nr:NAD(P)-binding Rossmann-fold superfamily protein [Rhynchospora pubera]
MPNGIRRFSFSMASSSSPIETSSGSSLNATSSSAVGMNDLLIVGPGVLGRIIAKLWQQEFPARNWNGEGSFLFTSSSAPYDNYDNYWCYEDSPVVPLGRSPRTDVLLKAEDVVLEAGGCVLRLAEGIVDARPDHILNLIHYEDAASLSIAIMKKRLRSRIFCWM